jgi:predicted aspartyl protease
MKFKYIIFSLLLFGNLCFGSESIFHVPFEIKENVIIISANINGVPKNFIFDSGAQALVINQNYIINEINKAQTHYNIQGVNSSFSQNTKYIVSEFKLGEIYLDNFSVLALDISLLEEHTGVEIFGLIGYEIFKDYDVYLDYDECYISFVPHKDFTTFWNQNIINREFETIGFEKYAHIPVIKAKVGAKEIHLGVDTGSARIVIDNKALTFLQHNISNISEQQIIGIENKNITIKGAKIKKLMIGNQYFNNLDILINDLSHLQKSGKIDGLIGYDLISKYNTFICYSNNVLVLIK